jgi:hypothetical protein
MRLFLTHADTVAFDAALRRKFPKMRIFMAGRSSAPELTYCDDIVSDMGPFSGHLYVIVDEPAWEPVFEEVTTRFGDVYYRISNLPERLLYFHRYSISKAGSSWPDKANLAFGWPKELVAPSQQALAREVKRLLRKIGTFNLAILAFDCTWVPVDDEDVFAGHDAVRWCLENEERWFDGYYRPIMPKRRASSRVPRRRPSSSRR